MAINPIKSVTSINFKQNTSAIETKTNSYPNDSVEISAKQKTAPTEIYKNSAIGMGAALFAFTGITLCFARHKKNKILKLYKEKLFLSDLASKIEFQGCKTLEEGIKFAKEVLGIKEIDKNFTIDALNIAIRGLVDVSNANKGKVYMPKRLGFEAPKRKDDDYLAYVVRDINSPKFGDLVINKNYFDEKVLNKELDEILFYNNGEKIYDINSATNDIQGSWKAGCVYLFPKKAICKLIDKYYKNKAALSIQEKQTLFYSLDYAHSAAMSNHRNPIDALKQLAKDKPALLKDNNLEINFADVEKMKTDKQVEYLENLVNKLEAKGSYWEFWYDIESPSCVINHEMGHLQDFAKNLKELDIMKWQYSWKHAWRNAKNNVKNRVGVDEVDNRWGSLWKDSFKELLEKNPKKFKKLYPDFYEFVNNQQIQQTAGKISAYAQSGIGEFIAEVYAMIISKKKIPDDVMTLYKKYNGPMLN